MNKPAVITLYLIAAMATPAFAQENGADVDTMSEEVVEDTADTVADVATELEEAMTDTVAPVLDDVLADDATVDDSVAQTQDAMADAAATQTDTAIADAPTLEDIAASDPNLSVTTDEAGEVDAMVMLSDVLFGFGDATLAPDALVTLRGIADKLEGVTALEITGHTDSIGDEAFNLALGQRRADVVRDWLVANTDLTVGVVTARGVGEVDPLAPNLTPEGTDNPEGRAQNRRVEFTLPDES